MRCALLLLAACGATQGGGRSSGDDPLEVTIEEITRTGLDDRFSAANELVAQDVAQRRAGRHGELPPLQESAEEEILPDAWPTVTIRNGTEKGLVVWFAGPCARTVALAPTAELLVELCEGDYDVAAQLAADDVLPFVGDGEELVNGTRYEITFYVMRPGERPRIRRRRRR